MWEKTMSQIADIIFLAILIIGTANILSSVYAWAKGKKSVQPHHISIIESFSLLMPVPLYYLLMQYTDLHKWFCAILALWFGSFLSMFMMVQNAPELPKRDKS